MLRRVLGSTIFFMLLVVFELTINYGYTNEMNMDECSKQIIEEFFPVPFVNSVLKEYQVSPNLWPEINEALTAKSPEVFKIITSKAAEMRPNPLRDPKMRNVVIQLFREAIFQVFREVMVEYGIHEDIKLTAMLDEIRYKKNMALSQCIDALINSPPAESQSLNSGESGFDDELETMPGLME